MRGIPLLAFLAVLAMGLAGCGSKGSVSLSVTNTPAGGPSLPPQVVNRTIASAIGLSMVGDPVPVSVPGHRTSEFTVATDPTDAMHLVAVGMDWDSPDGTVQCAAFVSRDGGTTWKAVEALPGHVGTNEDTDPWVAIDGKGVVYLTCTEAGVGLLLGKSLDGGTTWQTAQVVPTGSSAAKDALGAFDDGQLYLCYQTNVLHVLISKDAGASWNDAGFSQISAGCNGVVRGPTGDIYVVWQGAATIEADRLTPGPPTLGIVVSHDAGKHWDSLLLSSDTGTAPQNLPGAPQSAAPSIAVSNVTGSLFVAAQQYQNVEVVGPVGSATHANALLWRSRDQGRSFDPLKMPTFPSEACATCNLVHPTLAVDAGGRLVLQATLSNDQSTHKEYWMTVSADEGQTWLAPVLLALTDQDQSYVAPGNFLPDPAKVAQDAGAIAQDPAHAPGAAQALVTHQTWSVFHRDGGEYFGIATTPGKVVDLWVQHDKDGKNIILARHVKIESIESSPSKVTP